MIELRKGDSKIVAHARRELELAKLFTPNEAEKYDGFIGRGVLALVKTFDQWAEDDQSKMAALHQVFNFLIQGDLLSPPTDDPDEWEEFDVEGKMYIRNKRNNFYITRDDRKTWFNLRTDQRGICIDHTTGEPLEGVEDPNGTKASEDKESTADADNSGDGRDAELAAVGETEPDTQGKSSDAEPRGEDPSPVEEGKLDSGVEPESSEDSSKAETSKKES